MRVFRGCLTIVLVVELLLYLFITGTSIAQWFQFQALLVTATDPLDRHIIHRQMDQIMSSLFTGFWVMVVAVGCTWYALNES